MPAPEDVLPEPPTEPAQVEADEPAETLAAEPPTGGDAQEPLVEKAPAKKAPAKKAPAKKAPAKKAPAKKAPAKKAVAPLVSAEAEATSLPDLLPGLRHDTTVLPARANGARWPGAVLALTVLLLAGALALGVASLVLRGATTWRSEVSVRLVPGSGTTEDPLVQLRRVRDQIRFLTGPASKEAGVPEDHVRADLRGDRRGTDSLILVAQAARPEEAL